MVYNYTTPRVPISAMFNNPGPAYYLPSLTGYSGHDPRSIHPLSPCYSLRRKHGKLVDDCSPGPAYKPNDKIYKDGKDGTPHFTLKPKSKDLAGFNTPGAGAYSPEKSGPQAFYRSPTFAFGMRTSNRKSDHVPAPNAYTLDNMIGSTVRADKKQSAQFTMRPKTAVGNFCEDLAKTPGPANYSVIRPDTYKRKCPQYSMTGRNNMPSDNTQKPGPGTYRPERVVINKNQRPKFSFGIRHSDYICPIIVEPVA